MKLPVRIFRSVASVGCSEPVFGAGLEGVLSFCPAQRVVIGEDRTRVSAAAVASQIWNEVFREQNVCGKEELTAFIGEKAPHFVANRVRTERGAVTVVPALTEAEAKLVDDGGRQCRN